MSLLIYNFFLILFLFIPLFLITGPAIPDIIISCSALYFLINYLILNKSFFIFREKVFVISIFFWFTLIFVSFFALNKQNSFQDSLIFIRFLFIPLIAYYFFFNNEKKIKILVYIIFITVCFVLLDSLFQFYNYSSKDGFGYDLLGFKSNWYGRLTGPFGDELVPGAYVSKFGLIGYVFFFFIKKNKTNYILQILYLSIISLVCFASGERMALATFFLALFFLLLFMKNKRSVFFITIIISLIFIGITYKTHPFYNDYEVLNSTQYHQGMKIEKSFKCEKNIDKECKKIINIQPSFIEILKNFKTSAYGEIYSLAIIMFKDHPFTGVGINNYKFACINNDKYKKEMKNYDCASHPHNIYIQWLSEGGIIALFSFLVYLGYLFNFIIFGKNHNQFKIISLAVMIIIFWPIMSTGSLIKNWNGVLTFYVIANCIVLSQIKLSNLN